MGFFRLPQAAPLQLLNPHRYYNHLTPADNRALEDRQCDEFVSYVDERSKTAVCLINPATKKYIEKIAIESTRYHEKGREKARRKIRMSLRRYKSTHGILLTLTYADQDNKSGCYEGLSRPDAWQGAGYRPRAFLDELKKLRKRRGMPKTKGYLKSLEVQEKRGYPHSHIWFPNLYRLADIEEIQKLWPWGNVAIDRTWRNSPVDYITKYISKMDGQDFMQAMIWSNNLRVYSMSRDFHYDHEKKVDTGWRFLCSGASIYATERKDQIIGEGYVSARSGLIPPPDS